MERLVGTDERTQESVPIFARNNRILTGLDASKTVFDPDDLEITLVAKTVSGAGTVSGVLSLSEAW